MNKEELTTALKYTEKKHRHDTVNTFDTDISMMCSDVLRVLKNCIEIPEGATNGDVIKVLFPNAWKSNYIDIDNKCTLYIDDDYELEVDIDWWNSPYKTESEE